MEQPQRHIRLLPAAVANKIAAGEVVERPASAVKELVENSFDAGATRLEVAIVAGGRKLISVADNGCGMCRDDALLCLEPQATSKIRDVDDIERISTYGFRGEAMPSIASVSRMDIKTCAAGDEVGTHIEIDGGKIRSVTEIGFPAGTTVEVRDLFFNVPARRKFLKTYATEQAHIRSTVTLQALAHPEASIDFSADGRKLISVAGGATLKERVHDLFGPELLDSLREVSHADGGVSVTGFVALPTLARADRSEQYVFVNRRAATAPVIHYALKEAYPPLEGDRKPVAILFIDLPPEEVDVNVHPTKREVRFRDSRAVREAIVVAVQKALGLGPFSGASAPAPAAPEAGTAAASPPPAGATDAGRPAVEAAAARRPEPDGAGAQPPQPSPIPRGGAAAWPPIPVGSPLRTLPPVQQELRIPDSVEGEEPGLWKWCRILGQIAGGYLLMETDGGYVIINPQAAHERILYERMLDGAREGRAPSQALLVPQSVTLPAEDARRIADNLEELRAIGIVADILDDNVFIVEGLPAGMEPGDARMLLADISSGIAEAGAKRAAEDWKLKTLARAAAESAVRRTGPIPWKSLASIVEALARTRMPYNTPGGNPTMFFTSTRELDRKFGLVK